jgi:1-acyl-sn-glycerol-3-phosphate acyltransferase
MARWPRAMWRVLRLLVHLVHGALVCALLFPRLIREQRAHERFAWVSWWNHKALRCLGIALQHSGTPQPGPVLVVANHISWLDILAINAVAPVRFVSKAEVRHWPVLGWFVAQADTLFIERERSRDAMRVVHHIGEALQAGQRVGVFPEGTTSPGGGVLPFHANLLQAAIAVQAPVQPVVLRYRDARDGWPSPAAAYVGDMNLMQSLSRVLLADGLQAQVSLLPAHHTAPAPLAVAEEPGDAPAPMTRRVLAAHLQAEFEQVLAKPLG